MNQTDCDTLEFRQLTRRSGELDLLACYSNGPCKHLRREQRRINRKLVTLHLTYAVSFSGVLTRKGVAA